MVCKTCDHTMQRVNGGEPKVFWCPRCGTLKTEGMVPEEDVPKIVGRAHALCTTLDEASDDCPINVEAWEYRVRSLKECW